MSCIGECNQCVNYDFEDDFCYEVDCDAPDARIIMQEEGEDLFEPLAPEEFAERYMQDLNEVENEIETRNISGTSIERLKLKYPDKKFI